MSNDLARRVYQVFDPGPLRQQDSDLYVELDQVRGSTGVVARLADRIRLSDKATCQILAGHRGSGKSTELRRLQHLLQQGDDRVFVVYCKADDDIDRNDVDFPEVLIALVRQMAAQLKDSLKISLKPGLIKDRVQRIKHLLASEISFDKVGLAAGLLSLSAAIKGSPDARLEIRKLLEPDTSNWLHAAYDLIGLAKLELAKKGYSDLVVIVDDLDKMVLRTHPTAGCSTGEYLFVHREAQLTDFQCHVIYTMPIALAYSSLEPRIANLYGGHPPVMPMVKIAEPPPARKRFAPGFQKFREMIRARLKRTGAKESDVFKSAAVRDELIRLSGGQPRVLMLLIREAIVGGDLPIDAAAVDRARQEGTRAYARQLRKDHRPILDEVRKTGALTRTEQNDAIIRELLDSRAILQYTNAPEWYAVNPLIACPVPPRARKRKK